MALAASVRRARRWGRWLAVLAALAVVLAAVTWHHRECWLAAMVHAWVVNDPVERADAVMVLGGGAQFRSFEAVRFHRGGLAGKVLFPHIKPGADEPDATTSRETSLINRVLAHGHVPAEAREQIGRNVTSTRDEVIALRTWAEGVQARIIIVPTDPFHTRRLKALIHSIFAGSATRVLVTVVDPPGYRWQEWWRDEHGVLAFQTELLKSVQNAFK